MYYVNMTTNQPYHVDLSVLLKPIWFNNFPNIRIGVNGKLDDVILDKDTWFNYSYNAKATTNILQIELYGKNDNDSDMANNKDTAVVIEQIKFNSITSPKFAWKGVYTPKYPVHYIENNTTAASTLSPCTYLGWNGIWTLEFTVPVFTWIHKLEDLGWIYD